MQNIGLIVMGAITLLSMIMMIGNVVSKSPYGKYWAMLGGSSLLLAGLLLALPHFLPTSKAQAATQKPTQNLQTPQTNADSAADPAKSKQTDAKTNPTPNAETNAGEAVQADSSSPDLSFLVSVMDALKQGKPIPAEYLAFLPDGGQGLKSAGVPVASGNTSHPLSHTLQTQIASMARSSGDPFIGANTYVPSQPNNINQPTYAIHPSESAGTGATKATGGIGSTGATQETTPSNNSSAGSGSNAGSTTKGSTTPAPAAPEPSSNPAPAPSSQGTDSKPVTVPDSPALIGGQLLASVLGKSEADVNNYFRYNQPLGKVGNVISFIRGTADVDVTMSGGVATQVKMTYNRFTPQGQTMSFYTDYLRNEAGLTKASPTSQSGSDITWSGVYPGASRVVFHIDTSANYGYVLAQR